jgi:hypothetical protein
MHEEAYIIVRAADIVEADLFLVRPEREKSAPMLTRQFVGTWRWRDYGLLWPQKLTGQS